MSLGNYSIPDPDSRLYGPNPDNAGGDSEEQQRKERKNRIDEITVILEDRHFRAAAMALIGQHTNNDINKLGENGVSLLNNLNDKSTYKTSKGEKKIAYPDDVLGPSDNWIKEGNKALKWIVSSIGSDVYSVALGAVE